MQSVQSGTDMSLPDLEVTSHGPLQVEPRCYGFWNMIPCSTYPYPMWVTHTLHFTSPEYLKGSVLLNATKV